jgi:hypothetical protein
MATDFLGTGEEETYTGCQGLYMLAGVAAEDFLTAFAFTAEQATGIQSAPSGWALL